jgi:hypothetical protein
MGFGQCILSTEEGCPDAVGAANKDLEPTKPEAASALPRQPKK